MPDDFVVTECEHEAALEYERQETDHARREIAWDSLRSVYDSPIRAARHHNAAKFDLLSALQDRNGLSRNR